MDTASKRSSAMNIGCPWRGLWPLPDGTVGQLDRQHTAFMYAGITAGEAAVVVNDPNHAGFIVNISRLMSR